MTAGLRWSEDQLAAHKRKTLPPAIVAVPERKRSRMNKLETAYAQLLDLRKHACEVAWWAFEAIKLRLADGTFYTPDFCVIVPSGALEFHETKGFWRDDARVKIKVAAELFPHFTFRALTRKKGEWRVENFVSSQSPR